jgi:hypothetical protein
MFRKYFLNATFYVRISFRIFLSSQFMCYHSQKKIFPLQKIHIFRDQLSASQVIKKSQYKYYDIHHSLVSRMLTTYFKYVTYKRESSTYMRKRTIMKSFALPNFIIFQNT